MKGSVIRYDGKRGTVWRIKYADADGKQVMETIGAERDGVTRKQASEALSDRLSDVRRKGYRRPRQLTFAEYVKTWKAEGERRRAWKPGTIAKYRSVLRRLEEAFGPQPLDAIRPRDVAAYIRDALDEFAPKTVNLDVNVLHDIMKTAIGEELVDRNPVNGVERPKVRRRRWRILTPVEVARVSKAFTDERARVAFLTLFLTGLRRFELQGLRWADIDFVEMVLRVRESKTEDGERSIALSPTLAEALWQLRRGTRFQGDGEFVFAHPKRGSKLDHEWFAGELRAALKEAGITDYVRPFHDLRHGSLTNGAAAGEQPLELMTRAGHRSMATTRQYLDLAGITFPDAARALERRLLGVESSTDLSESQVTSPDEDAALQADNAPDPRR